MEPIYNKKAHFDYEILEKYEAGIVLFGHEVKSVKSGQMDLKGSYITVKQAPPVELFLINGYIPKYKPAGELPNYEPRRTRKILVHRREIRGLIGKLAQKGLTLVPLRVYTKHNLIKIEFGVARGKKKFDKRETIKERELDRQTRRILKGEIN